MKPAEYIEDNLRQLKEGMASYASFLDGLQTAHSIDLTETRDKLSIPYEKAAKSGNAYLQSSGGLDDARNDMIAVYREALSIAFDKETEKTVGTESVEELSRLRHLIGNKAVNVLNWMSELEKKRNKTKSYGRN